MNLSDQKPTLKTAELLFYFWLPAGRDEFEFSRCDSSFRGAAKYRTGSIGETISIEETIAKRLMNKLRLAQENSLEGLQIVGDIDLRDADLDLRKVEFKFRYECDPQILSFGPKELTGCALILSNGLYLWLFNFEYPSNLSDEEIAEAGRKFLREDFVERHISTLFEFKWTEQRSDLSSYDGVLTYYQIDLLFNSLFDKDAHPDNFMNARSTTRESVLYDVRGVIQSASLVAIRGHHSPLFDELEDISLENGPRDAPEPTVLAEIESFETRRDIKNTEQWLSRISYSGMEQFIKVAISFSIIHYKAGLDHCRAQLTNDALLIRINKTAGELRRPSLSTSLLSLADLQSYTSIVAGKLPALLFLRSLVEDLAQASRPFGAQNGSVLEGPDWAEWIYSRSTLNDSLLYYELQVECIRDDINEINRSLAIGRNDQIITELTDSRKIAEIESESREKNIFAKSGREVDALMVRFTLLALVFSAVQAYASIGVWAMDRLTDAEGFFPPTVQWWQILVGGGQWIVVSLVLFLIYFRLRKRSVRGIASNKKKGPVHGAASGEPDEFSKEGAHVFDYSFLHEKLEDGAAKMIDDLAQSMPNIEPIGERLACANRSSFRETPLSAVERTKYTLDSPNSTNGSYIFHIEIDRRMNSRDEYLREVRLVIKKPVERRFCVEEDVQHCAQRIILDCVRHLAFKDGRQKVLRLIREQFIYG